VTYTFQKTTTEEQPVSKAACVSKEDKPFPEDISIPLAGQHKKGSSGSAPGNFIEKILLAGNFT
jgi:hypothetical protein